MKNYSFKRGFTLAEVLITLGIIGVVAALAIPTLVSKYQEKVLVNKAKKGYAILMQALERYNSDNYSANSYSYLFKANESDVDVLSKLVSYMRVEKICERYTDAPCGGSYPVKNTKPKNNGQGFNSADGVWGARAVLNDGMIIGLQNQNEKTTSCGYDYTYPTKDENGNPITATGTTYQCGRIWIDTNGIDGPNRYGSDVFAFTVKQQTIVPSLTDCDINYVITEGKIVPYIDYVVGGEYVE